MAALIKFSLSLVVIGAFFMIWRWKRAAAEQKELEFIFFADENRQLDKPETHKNRK